MISIDEVKNVSFRKSGMGGYKAEDVDNFIDEVVVTLTQLESEKSDIMKKIEILAKKIEAYRADEEIIRNALLRSERIAEEALNDANQKAQAIVSEAEQKAQTMLAQADAQTESKKQEYIKLSKEAANFRSELLSMYKKQLELIKELPDERAAAKVSEGLDERYPTAAPAEKEPAQDISKPQPAAQQESASVPTQRVSVAAPAEEKPASAAAEAALKDGDEPEYIIPTREKKAKKFSVLKFGDEYDMDDE